MSDVLLSTESKESTAIELVAQADFDTWFAQLSTNEQAWITSNNFSAESGQVSWLPDDSGQPRRVVVGFNGQDNLSTLGSLPFALRTGDYPLTTEVSELQLLGWALGAYQFLRYRSSDKEPARLQIPKYQNAPRLNNFASAITLVRDLINTPTSDMLPSDLADAAASMAKSQGATCKVITGDDLLADGFRTIHAVGRASVDAPRLIDIRWGDEAAPKVVLVGKGVCFDSGGLDLKPAAGMRLMKKDMGGAAQVLGLGQLIMAEKLPLNLRILVPAVENAVAGNAFRPGDVIKSYQGLTVEIDNTDAEGRLVLCDALALAAESEPELIVDFATLTGSARSAVGAEIAAMFTNDDEIASGISDCGRVLDDPVWRMPLHSDYDFMLESKVADVVNSASSPYAGAITAALFLQKFVNDVPWVHFDIMAFNTRARPGHPEGGEAMGVRAVFEYLERRFQ